MRKEGGGTTQKWRLQGKIGHRAKVPEAIMEGGGRQGQGQGSTEHVGTIGYG